MHNAHVIDQLRYRYRQLLKMELRGFSMQGEMFRTLCALRYEAEGGAV